MILLHVILSQVPLHLSAAKDITELAQKIQGHGGVLYVDEMPKTDPDTNPSGSQPKPTEVAPPVVPTSSKTTTRGTTQRGKTKAQKEATKLLQAQQKEERAKIKEAAVMEAFESAQISADMIKIEDEIKKGGVTIPQVMTPSSNPAPAQVVTAPSTPSTPKVAPAVVTAVTKPHTPKKVNPASTVAASTPGFVHPSTAASPVKQSPVKPPRLQKPYTIPKDNPAVVKVTQALNLPKVAVPQPTPVDSISYALETSVQPGMKKWVSDPDQNGWRKFDEEINLYAGFKSKLDGKIYRVKIIAEHHGKKAKGIITCYNQVKSILPDDEVLPDPGVNIVDPSMVVPPGNQVSHFPDDAPVITNTLAQTQTVNTTTAASALINSIPASLTPQVNVAVVTTNNSVHVSLAQSVPTVSTAQQNVPPVVSIAQNNPPISTAQSVPVVNPSINPVPVNNQQTGDATPFAQLNDILTGQIQLSASMLDQMRSSQNTNAEFNNFLINHFLKNKEDDEEKHLAKPRNINVKITELTAFQDNMSDSLSPGRFLTTGTNMKIWGNSIPTKFEPRSNLALEEYGLIVNNFTAVHKAHDRTDSKLQLKHFKTDNLHKVEESSKLKFDGSTFTQVSGLTDIQTIAQALEVSVQ